MGTRLILEGLKSFGDGAESLGRSFERSNQRDKEEELRLKKEEQGAALKARLGDASNIVGDLSKRVKDDPNLSLQDFETEATKLSQIGLETGDKNLSSTVDDLRNSLVSKQRQADGRAALEIKNKDKRRKEDRKTANKLSKEKGDRLLQLIKRHENNPNTKTFNNTSVAFDRIQKLSTSKPSAGRDWGFVFNVLKVLDPNSTIREGEFKSVAEARAWVTKVNWSDNEDGSATTTDKEGNTMRLPSKVAHVFRNLDSKKKGSFLTDVQVKDFSEMVRTSFRSRAENQALEEERTTAVSDSFEVDNSLIIGKNNATDRLKALDEEDAQRAIEEEQAKQDMPTAPEESKAIVVSSDFLKKIAEDPNKKITQKFQELKTQFEASKGRPMTDQEEEQSFRIFMRANNLQLEDTQ